MPVYLDCSATTPVESEVLEELVRFTVEDFGNSASRTHEYGARAKRRVAEARSQVANVVEADSGEVIFTSGATEANNIALLGLAAHGRKAGKRHIISSQIEHKAVLEPLEHLQAQGFEVTLLAPDRAGVVNPDDVGRALGEDTLCVSIMHANNETGVIQPIPEIAAVMRQHEALLHVDAAQTFGKRSGGIDDNRVDLISISGHKIYGPKGVGALIARRRAGSRKPPLTPLMFGGGQERGLRPGTIPVALVAALGTAAEISTRDRGRRSDRNLALRSEALRLLNRLGAQINGDSNRSLDTTINASIPGLDGEAAIVALKDIVAVSNGSACTSQSHSPSHVLSAMGFDEDRVSGAIRLSWCHLTPTPDWAAIGAAIDRVALAT